MKTNYLRTVSCLAFGLATIVTSAIRANNILWDGDTSTDYETGANWVGGTPPTSDLTTDIADFTGAFTNQPSINLSGAGRSVNGWVTGSNPVTYTSNYSGAGNNEFYIGSGGITTGSALFTANFTSTRFMVAADQSWNIGAGGMDWNALNASGQLNFTGAFTLTKSGPGTLDLRDAATTFAVAGKYKFANGIVVVDALDVLGGEPGALVADKFRFDGGTLRFDNGAGAMNMTGNRAITVDAGGGSLEYHGSSGANQITVPIAGSGDFTYRHSNAAVANPNFAIRNNTSGYTGKMTITGVASTRSDWLGDGSSTNAFAPDGKFHIDGSSGTLGTLLELGAGTNTYTFNMGALSGVGNNARIRTGAGAVTATLNINQSVDGTYFGDFSDTANGGDDVLHLVKQGNAQLTLTKANNTTLTRGTQGTDITVQQGRLVVGINNATGAANVPVIVQNGGTLASDVTGRSILNTVTTQGTNSGIDPAGTFTIPALNAAAGARFFMAPLANDLLALTGAFTDPTAAADGMTFAFASAAPDVIYNLIDFSSSPTLTGADMEVAVLPPNLVLDLAFGSGSFTNSGFNLAAGDLLQVRFTLIPEPASATLALLGIVGIISVSRRRRANSSR